MTVIILFLTRWRFLFLHAVLYANIFSYTPSFQDLGGEVSLWCVWVINIDVLFFPGTYNDVLLRHTIGHLIVNKRHCLEIIKKKIGYATVNDRDIYWLHWHEQRPTASAEFVKRNLFVIADRYMIRSLRYVESVVNIGSGYDNISMRRSPLFTSIDKRLAVNVVSDTRIFNYIYKVTIKLKDKNRKLEIRYD